MAYKTTDAFAAQFFDDNGAPAENHTLTFLVTGTSTPATIAFDTAGASTATSVTIGANGFPQNSGSDVEIYFDEAVTYDIVRKDSGGTAYGPTVTAFSVTPTSTGSTALGVLSAAGSAANAITADLAAPPSALNDQLQVVVELQHGPNTAAAVTFNLNSLGAKTIKRDDNAALLIGDTGGVGAKLYLSYSATNDVWILLNPRNITGGLITDGGSAADVLVATWSPATDVLFDHLTVTLELAHGANTTTTPTFNLSGLGAKTIKRDNLQALEVGDTGGTGATLYLSYSATNDCWILLNPAKLDAANAVYDNASSGLTATTVQAAIDEIAGAEIVLTSGTIGAVSELEFVLSTLDTTQSAYNRYKIYLLNFLPATDDVEFRYTISTDAGSTYVSSGYRGAVVGIETGAAVSLDETWGSAAYGLVAGKTATPALSNAAGETSNATITLSNMNTNASVKPLIETQSRWFDTAGDYATQEGGGTNTAAGDYDAIKFTFESGNYQASGYYVVTKLARPV